MALLAAVLVVGYVLLSGGSDYKVGARFENASQLVKGNLVQVSGVSVGTVDKIDLTSDGQAEVTMKITDGSFAPLRKGTKAVIRQASLSGVANRYIDLDLPPGDSSNTPKIPEGGFIDQTSTRAAVDLDQLFNTFDPKTRKALSGVIRGFGKQSEGASKQMNAGFAYLSPSLAASSRLFNELTYDKPALTRFLVETSRLTGDLAERRTDLSGLVDNLATTVTAIGSQDNNLRDAIQELPPFMRRANTTFVNLRATLDDVDPLVEESKPVAKKLRPFLAELRPLARDARPTLRNLSALIRSPGDANDLTELTRLNVPLRNVAVGPIQRNGKSRLGALPASTKALAVAAPELATARPYAPDLTGWFDDFSHSGVYDALGGASRVAPYVNAFANVNGVLKPLIDATTSLVGPTPLQQAATKSDLSVGQTWRCPGAVERGAIFKPTPGFPCDETQTPVGP